MATKCLVVNEWILHDLQADNGTKAQEESYKFLQKLKENGDCIALIQGCVWHDKAWQLMKHTDPVRRLLSQFLQCNILSDSNTCKLLSPSQVVPLTTDIVNLIPASDIYLIETYFSSKADTLITNDLPFYEAGRKIAGLNIELRDDFLKRYSS